MVATLDSLSGGRFTLAVAAGYLRGEYKALGIEFDQRNELFDQSLKVLRGVWSEDNFMFDGIDIEAHGLDSNPKPDPHPPIWIGGNSKKARRRVARRRWTALADGTRTACKHREHFETCGVSNPFAEVLGEGHYVIFFDHIDILAYAHIRWQALPQMSASCSWS